MAGGKPVFGMGVPALYPQDTADGTIPVEEEKDSRIAQRRQKEAIIDGHLPVLKSNIRIYLFYFAVWPKGPAAFFAGRYIMI